MSDRSRPHSRQKLLMQSSTTSGVSSIFLKMSFVSGCPPGFNPQLLPAESSCETYYLVLHTLLRRRNAAVAGVLVRIFIPGDAFAQVAALLLKPVHVAPPDRRFQYAARQWSHALTAPLSSGFFKHCRYVRNLLFHRYKGTKNI